VGAVELTPEGGERAHAVIVFRQRTGDGELAGAAATRRRLAGGRRLGGSLATLLGRRFLFLFGEVAGALGEGRGRRRGSTGFRFFFLEAPSGLLFGPAAGVLFGGLAGFFLGFALFRGVALAAHALFFNRASRGIFLGALAQLFFGELRVGQRA
jgi:hypothetical protein